MNVTTSFSNLCRLCLEPHQANVPIFKENETGGRELFEKISVCLPVKLSEDDCLPKNICINCHKSVDFIYNFWQISSNSEKQLKSMVENVDNMKQDFDVQECIDASPENTLILYETLEDKDTEDGDDEDVPDTNNIEIKEVYFGEYLNPCDTIEDENTVLINEESTDMKSNVDTLANEILLSNVNDDTTAQSSNVEDIQISQIVESSNVSLRIKSLKLQDIKVDDVIPLRSEIELICSICDERFANDSTINSHMKRLHKLYRCEICEKLFKQRSSLAYHKSTHSSVRRYKCEQCDISFKRTTDLKGHISRVHEEVKESDLKKCSVCGFKTKCRRRYEIHVLSHVGSYLYYCDQCGKGFNDTLGLRTHLNNHLGIKPFQCDVCGKKFTREPYMKQHRRKVHEQPLSFECDMCGKKFSFKCSLTKHLSKEHIDKDKIVEYQCPVCKRMIKSKPSLRNHIKIHTGEKPFSCTECSKMFATKLQLQRHSFRHSDYKAFQCEICKKGFAYKRLLVIHKRIHQEDRMRHSCYHCGNHYLSKHKLIAHIKRHHLNNTKTAKE